MPISLTSSILNPESSPLYKDVQDFLREFAKNNQSLSIKVKKMALAQFISYLDDLTILNWQELHLKDIKSYICLRASKMPAKNQKTARLLPLSPASLRTHLSALRVFFKYLVDQKILPKNPILALKSPKLPQRLVKSINPETLINIIEQQPNNQLEIRDLAMLELFYASGLRLAELTNLCMHDLDFSSKEVRVNQGKGGKDRVIPLGSKAQDALLNWFEVRATWLKDSTIGTVFLNKHGLAISARQVSNRIKQFAKKSMPGINLHPHLLRHSMATHVLEGSADIRAVQELLGHADISSTEVYTQLDFAHLCRVYDSAHPRAHMKNLKKPK